MTARSPAVYVSLGVRWDNVEGFRVWFNDGSVEDIYSHISNNICYFGYLSKAKVLSKADGHSLSTMKLRVKHDPPPIPLRQFDWTAVDDSTYDGAPDSALQHIGHGPTSSQAIVDLLRSFTNIA